MITVSRLEHSFKWQIFGGKSQDIFELLFCEVVLFEHVDKIPCFRRMSDNSAEQVVAGFFIRYFFELPGEIQVVPADEIVPDEQVSRSLRFPALPFQLG